MSNNQLTPGNYFIELAFKRKVTEGTLSRALAAMGFVQVEFDKHEDSAVGALALTSTTASRTSVTSYLAPKTTPVASAITSSPVAAATQPVSAQTSTTAAKSSVTALAAPAPTAPKLPVSDSATATVSPSRLAAMAPSMATSSPTSSFAKPVTASSTSTNQAGVARNPNAPVATQDDIGPIYNVEARGQGQGQGQGQGPQAYQDPDPNGHRGGNQQPGPSDDAREGRLGNQRFDEADAGPGRGHGPSEEEPGPSRGRGPNEDRGERGRSDEAPGHQTAPGLDRDGKPVQVRFNPVTGKPITEEAVLSKFAQDMQRPLSLPAPDRWKRWVEWGSPFATSAGYMVNISGEEDDGITRFRFVGTLTRTLRPQNLPDMSWVFIRRMGINPFADLSFQLTPFKLQRDHFYEFRFFSRMKSNPTKDSVKETLANMGFSPMKLNLLKKNMRIPRRGNVSVCLWLGIGKWSAPNSVVTSEDPFFFESMREVQP